MPLALENPVSGLEPRGGVTARAAPTQPRSLATRLAALNANAASSTFSLSVYFQARAASVALSPADARPLSGR